MALRFSLSSLLVMMSLGFALANLSRAGERAATALDGMTAPIFMCFFTLSGADLDFKVFASVGFLALVYVVMRVVGKVAGATAGAKIADMPKTVQKYLGLTLVPQAGVAIGLSLAASRILADSHGQPDPHDHPRRDRPVRAPGADHHQDRADKSRRDQDLVACKTRNGASPAGPPSGSRCPMETRRAAFPAEYGGMPPELAAAGQNA
ncbi:MAG: hypothetical protein ACOX5G_08950 [Kiritimatiellia bacterium]